jgi:hypothetical protein
MKMSVLPVRNAAPILQVWSEYFSKFLYLFYDEYVTVYLSVKGEEVPSHKDIYGLLV